MTWPLSDRHWYSTSGAYVQLGRHFRALPERRD
jgi:hypothetical protein